MPAIEAFSLNPPTEEDLNVALRSWESGVSRYALRTDDSWWRLLRAKDPEEAVSYARTAYPSDALNRFSPVVSAGHIVPAAYAGSTRKVALWEIVLRDVRHRGIRLVPERDVRNRYLIEVRVQRPLTLFDTRRPRDANLVEEGKRPPDLARAWPSAYGLTRAWAQSLYDVIPNLEGIIYESHQVEGHCVILFAAPDTRVFELHGEPCAISDNPARKLLIDEARKSSASVDFGFDDEDLS